MSQGNDNPLKLLATLGANNAILSFKFTLRILTLSSKAIFLTDWI
jgi:hypothetical protein